MMQELMWIWAAFGAFGAIIAIVAVSDNEDKTALELIRNEFRKARGIYAKAVALSVVALGMALWLTVSIMLGPILTFIVILTLHLDLRSRRYR